jgi:glycosyltransferase involved in cell wall biosynthesis
MARYAKKISVVIPCYAEGKTIFENIEKIHDYLGQNFDGFEIIAVSDGSPDNTVAELKRVQKRMSIVLIENEINGGKGKAVRDGMLVAMGDIVMFMDADLAIPIESLDTFIPEIEKGNDVVIASRLVPGLKVLKPVLWYRKYMERVFAMLRMLIINNYAVRDTQCGFKVFTRKATADIFPLLTIKRFAFDAEIIFLAGKKKYRIKEMPITLQNPERSSIRIVRDSANMLYDLMRIRWNDFKGKYKI